MTNEKRKIFGRYDLITFAQLFTVCALVFSVVFGSIGIMTGMQTGRANSWNGDPASNFAGGTGTAASPYLISNAGQLALMRRNVNDGSAGFNTSAIHYKLTADIYLNTTTGWTNWSETSGPTNIWEPIGVWRGTEALSTPFRANFDGDNYVIYGLYVNAKNVSGTPISVDRQGLFGWAEGARIRNVGIDQGFVRGGNFTGGIVGFANNTSILDNIWNGCTIRGTQGTTGTQGEGGYYIMNPTPPPYGWIRITAGNGGTGGIFSLGGVAGHAIVYNGFNKGEVIGGAGGSGGGAGGGAGTNPGNDGSPGSGMNGGAAGAANGTLGAGGVGGTGGNSFTGGIVGYGSVFNCYNSGSITGGRGGHGGGGGGSAALLGNLAGGAGGTAGVSYAGGVAGAVYVITSVNATTGALTGADGDAINIFNSGQINAGARGQNGTAGASGANGGRAAGGTGGAGAQGAVSVTGGIAGWSANNRIKMGHYQTGRGATTHAGATTITTIESSAFNASGVLSPGVLGGYTTLVGAMNRGIEVSHMPTLPSTVTRYRRWAGTGINITFADIIRIEYNPSPFSSGNTIVDNKEFGVDIVLRGSTFTRTHYLQTKWQDATGKTYEFVETYTANTAVVLFPVWALNDNNAAALRYELTNVINDAQQYDDPVLWSQATLASLRSAIDYGMSLLSPASNDLANIRTAIANINSAVTGLELRISMIVMYSPGPQGTGSSIVDNPEVGQVILRGALYTRLYYTQIKWQDSLGNEYEFGEAYTTNAPLVLYPVWELDMADATALRFELANAINNANQYNNPQVWSSATLVVLQGAIDYGQSLLSLPSTDHAALEAAIMNINSAIAILEPRVSVVVMYNPGPHGIGVPIVDSLEVGDVTLRGSTYTRLYYTQTKWRDFAGVEYAFGAKIDTTTPLVLYPVWQLNDTDPEAVSIVLQELVDEAMKLDKDNVYTQATLLALRNAIAEAQALIDEESKNLIELLAAVEELNNAVGGLVARPPSSEDGDGGGGGSGNIIDQTTILILGGFAFVSLIIIVLLTRLKKPKKVK